MFDVFDVFIDAFLAFVFSAQIRLIVQIGGIMVNLTKNPATTFGWVWQPSVRSDEPFVLPAIPVFDRAAALCSEKQNILP